MKYYYSDAKNNPVGPIEWEKLQALATQGVINDETPVIPEGGQAWTTYGQIRSGTVVANAMVSGLSQASSAAASFPWGATFFGILLAIIGFLVLPWTVFVGAARELASWGKRRALPLATSDLPVLTFYTIVAKNAFLVIFGAVFTLCAILALFGAGPLYRSGIASFIPGLSPYGYGSGYQFEEGWNAGRAFAGFFEGLLIAYFGQILIALCFESISLFVRIANDVKKLASK